jgi:hypothetical protein
MTQPDPSVPLSAILALVQQWREDVAGYRRREYNGVSWQAVALEVERRADQLAALCPPVPKDET